VIENELSLSATSTLAERRPRMKERKLKLSDLALIASTRGMLGAGIGLLLSSKLNKDQRRAAGWALVAVGAVTTVPLVMKVFGKVNDEKRSEA